MCGIAAGTCAWTLFVAIAIALLLSLVATGAVNGTSIMQFDGTSLMEFDRLFRECRSLGAFSWAITPNENN
jgi:hypothetical protein